MVHAALRADVNALHALQLAQIQLLERVEGVIADGEILCEGVQGEGRGLAVNDGCAVQSLAIAPSPVPHLFTSPIVQGPEPVF